MDIVVGFVFLALQAAVVVGIIVLIVRATRRSGTAPERGVHALRRFLQYSFLLAALIAAAIGLTRLLGTALPAGAMAGSRTVELALGLSLTLVAAPAWMLLWRLVVRRLSQDPQERAASRVGHIPFTPRAKKVLELSLRESRHLGHDHIGTEHILLGLLRVGEGLARQVLDEPGVDDARAREVVLSVLTG
jgi:hypothetical protein